ncbi:MAG TPA: HXXEE domain-containing protein [Opitutaceae bacterium]|nr:HXXEE domain-containing protein [Opitutaceae bacterium]
MKTVREKTGNPVSNRPFGYAWLALCGALAIHVTDEALTDFLSVYNPAVDAIRARLPFLPLPTFTFNTWLAGLILAILVLSILSVLAFRGGRLAAWLAYPYAAIMLVNGLGHFGGSIYLGRWMPGVYSAPLLLFASVLLFVRAREAHRRANQAARMATSAAP